MKRIESQYAVRERFVQGDLQTPKTPPNAAWLNGVQGELCSVVESAGLALDKANSGQMLEAIQKKSRLHVAQVAWDIPAQLTEIFQLDDIDSGLGYGRFCRGGFPAGTVNGFTLNGFKLDSRREVFATFYVRIERTVDDSVDHYVFPVNAHLQTRKNPADQTFFTKWAAYQDHKMSVGFPYSYQGHVCIYNEGSYQHSHELGSRLHVFIQADGQFVLIGTNQNPINYTGRIAIFDFKTVPNPNI